MTAAYQHLALTEVEPGMILSDDILDRQGQVLLPKGAVLTAQTIALLPSHGIGMLAVLRNAGNAGNDGQQSGPDKARVEARLARLFRKNPGDAETDPATALLRRCMTAYRLGRESAQ